MKRAAPKNLALAARIGPLLAPLIPWPIIRPTFTAGDAATVQEEGRRLRRFRQLALPVPPLLAQGEGCLFLRYAGRSIEELVTRAPDWRFRSRLVEHAIEALAQIHHAGCCHGRPFLKDILWDGERITFIDLEEDPASIMPIATAQARDVMLFLMSVAKHDGDLGAAEFLLHLFTLYRARNPSSEVHDAITRNWRLLHLLAQPLRLVPRAWLGRDLAAAARVLKAENAGAAALRRSGRGTP